MAYLLSLVVTGLFFFALHFFTELSKLQKLIISATLFIIILSAIFYNNKSMEQREILQKNVTKFQQHKMLKCNEHNVDTTNYTLSIGTYTFIGKKDTSHYGEMLNVIDCY